MKIDNTLNIKQLESDSYIQESRVPDITGMTMLSWFEKSFIIKNKLDSLQIIGFRKLAITIYKCIIDVDDQIDHHLGNVKNVSNAYLESIDSLSYSCGLSDSFRENVYSLYEVWMIAEHTLLDESKTLTTSEIHKCFMDKVGFLKLIPLALGEITADTSKAKKLCKAYDYAGIANGYIDDLIDYEEDKKAPQDSHLFSGLANCKNNSAKNSFLEAYLMKAITLKHIAVAKFNSQCAYDWANYCEHQIKGCETLLGLLSTFDYEYVLTNAKKYLKGT